MKDSKSKKTDPAEVEVKIPSLYPFVLRGVPEKRPSFADCVNSSDETYQLLKESPATGFYNELVEKIVVDTLAGGLEVETLKAVQDAIEKANPKTLRYDILSADVRKYVSLAIYEAREKRERRKKPIYQKMVNILSQKAQQE